MEHFCGRHQFLHEQCGTTERFLALRKDDGGALHQPPGQFPSITVSFNLAPNAALGEAIDGGRQSRKDLHMPPACRLVFKHRGIITNSLSMSAGSFLPR